MDFFLKFGFDDARKSAFRMSEGLLQLANMQAKNQPLEQIC